MARAMNVGKRSTALKSFVTRAVTNSKKAAQIAKELSVSFKDDKSNSGKQARKIAQNAAKLAAALVKASKAVSL